MPTSKLGRRKYLRAVGGSIGTIGITGTTMAATTADQVKLSGTLVSFDGDPVAGRKIAMRNGSRNEEIITNSSGFFETKVNADSYVHLGFYKSGSGQLHAPVKNGVPHIDELGRYPVGSTGKNLNNIKLARGYIVNLRALDEDGNPVPDAGFGFGADGYGSSNRLLSANNSGYLVINNADFTGIELAEPANVSIKIPTDGGAVMKYKESIYVDSPMTIIAQKGEGTTIKKHRSGKSTKTTTTIRTTTETTTTASTPTSTATSTTTSKTTVSTTSQTTSPSTEMAKSANGTESRSKRGFLSNGESAGDYKFLTDPFVLTVGGFVLSVAGIAQNLIRGR